MDRGNRRNRPNKFDGRQRSRRSRESNSDWDHFEDGSEGIVGSIKRAPAFSQNNSSGGRSSPSEGGSRMPSQVIGERTGTVKFFNPRKRFGFIAQDGDGDDVFLHVSEIEKAGYPGFAEGQKISFSLVDQNGRFSAIDVAITGDLLDYDSNGGGGSSGGGDRGQQPVGDLEQGQGTVKFFNTDRGFGFIETDSGGPDIFVHISAVERAGMRDLPEGTRLEFSLQKNRQGKINAVNLRELDS